MSATVEKLSQVKSKITITVDADTFEKSMEKAFRKTMKRYNIPGFRKGHAPRTLVERYYGPGVLYEDAFEIAFPDASLMSLPGGKPWYHSSGDLSKTRDHLTSFQARLIRL